MSTAWPPLLISGTDTAVGKTVLTSALLAYGQVYHPNHSLGLCKPIQSGLGDREHYQQLFTLTQAPETLNPLFFPEPLAPPLAAQSAGTTVDLKKVWTTLQSLQQHHDWVIIEGVGGLGCPVTWELTVADLARDWHLPIVLVVPVKLGAIAQAVANVALARQSQLQVLGIVLNCTQPTSTTDVQRWAPQELIQTLTQVPVLGVLPYQAEQHNLAQLASMAAALDLERFTPFQHWWQSAVGSVTSTPSQL